MPKHGKTLKHMREDHRNMPIEIALASDSAFKYAGNVDYIAPQVDAATGTLQLRGVLENKNVGSRARLVRPCPFAGQTHR